jgi:ketosteroid isomerase-like protein
MLATALITIAALHANAQQSNKDDAALRSLIGNMLSAQSAYDAAALDRIFTDDYIEISLAGEFDPRAKVLGYYKPEAKAAAAGVQVDVAEDFRSIRKYGGTAVVIAELAFSMEKDGKPLPTRRMIIIAVCRKEKGAWKVASVQYTGVRPAPPQAAKPE